MKIEYKIYKVNNTRDDGIQCPDIQNCAFKQACGICQHGRREWTVLGAIHFNTGYMLNVTERNVRRALAQNGIDAHPSITVLVKRTEKLFWLHERLSNKPVAYLEVV